MKQSILKGSILVLACASLLLAGSCGSNEVNPASKNNTTGKMPPPPPPPRAIPYQNARSTESVDTSKVYPFVDKMPSFPGGERALMKYISTHIHYPSVARGNGIQGTVVVQFIVDRDGTLDSVSTVGASKGGGLEQEAIRIVKGMPRWNPGSKKGVNLKVQYSLPIRFRIE